MGRYERLKTEIESGNGAQPLSESRYERLKKEMGESSSVSSTKTKKTKKPAPSSLDNRPKSETKKTTAAPPCTCARKGQKDQQRGRHKEIAGLHPVHESRACRRPFRLRL